MSLLFFYSSGSPSTGGFATPTPLGMLGRLGGVPAVGVPIAAIAYHYEQQGVSTMYLRQSTASQEVLLGPFVDDTDGKTAETGLTIANTDIKLWKEGGTVEANKNSGGATHIAGGRYYSVLDATDTDTLGKLEVNVHVAGALPVRRVFMVVPAMIYDSLFLGTDRFDANVTHAADVAWASGAITAAVVATDAIDADALAADAGTELGTAVWASATRALTDKAGFALSSGGLSAVTAWTVNITGTLSGSVGSIAAGGITASSFAAGAIDAAAIANGAIDAATFAADVDAEILSYLVDDATRIDASSLNTASVTTIPAIVADTNELQTDWANGGRLDLLLDLASGGVWTTALTESYGTDGSALTPAQLLYLILGNVSEFDIVTTTKTVRKLDGTTAAATYTLDSDTTPTSITRAT